MKLHALVNKRVRNRSEARTFRDLELQVAMEAVLAWTWQRGKELGQASQAHPTSVVSHHVEMRMRQHPFARIHNPLRQRVKFYTSYSGYRLLKRMR